MTYSIKWTAKHSPVLREHFKTPYLQEGGDKYYEMARTLFAVPLRYVDSSHVSTALRLWEGTKDVFSKNWHLGFTAFGGPPVHFQIVSHATQWLDEQALGGYS
jgi:hypothetical protein